MSIVITGITGCRNRGVEALIGPTLDQIRQQRPTQQITVLTHTPDYDAVQLQEPGVKFEKADFQVNSRGRRLWLRKKAASLQGKPLIIEPQTAAATAIREAALVIASGGDVFSSDYGSLQFHLAPLKLAQRHHLPVVFLAHSIGPFHSRQDTEAWLNVARQSLLKPP
jgi:colanic acid/amylovoran biosynthesis protein